jgi:ATP-dependent protease ClpP protease subunit
MSKYKVKAQAGDKPELWIYGDIGENWWEPELSLDAVTVLGKLANITADEIDVHINSYGGSLVDAIAIYNGLKRHAAMINTFIDGVAYSAAGVIAMAGDTVVMAANALFMIHGPESYESGNATKLRATADMLDKYAEAAAPCYMDKSGQSREAIELLLKDGKDHFYNAQEALQNGFIDSIGVVVEPTVTNCANPKALHSQWLNTFKPKGDNPMPNPNVTDASNAAVIEAARQADIKMIFNFVPSGREDVSSLLPTMLIDDKITVADARKAVLAKLGENAAPVMRTNHIEMGAEGRDRFIADAVSGILMKAGVEKRDGKNKFVGMSLSRIGEECLMMGRVDYSHDRRDMVSAAFTQTTSDFPIILENVMHKTLLNAYRIATPTWARWCKTGTVSDFRAHNRYRTGSIGNLDALGEAGEVKSKSIPDGERESITAKTKGNIIRVSREMIINDDMMAFTGISADLGRAASRTIEAGVYVYLLSNPVLSDGKTLFHADHGNIGSSSAPTMQLIEDGRVLMAKQTGVGGADILDIVPKTWLGGLKYGGTVRGINRSAYDPDAVNKLQKPNIVEGLFADVIDTARISGNAWYMFADPNEAPVIEVAFLDGNQEPILEMQNSWSTAGAEYRALLDFGIAALDYRGGYYNAGA